MADRPVIDYYFSFISLWSYIGSLRFQRLVQDTNAKAIYKPIDIMYTFSISGYGFSKPRLATFKTLQELWNKCTIRFIAPAVTLNFRLLLMNTIMGNR
jgi:2-hydroxychromene-2-carboxylate isomerase